MAEVRDRSELEALRTRVANAAASLAETVTEGVFNLARVGITRVGAPPELVLDKKAKQKLSMPMLVVFVLVMLMAAIVVYEVAQAARGRP